MTTQTLSSTAMHAGIEALRHITPPLPMPGTRFVRRYRSALLQLTLLLHASISSGAEMLETRNVAFDRTQQEVAFGLYNPTPKIATAWSLVGRQTRADGTQISIRQTRDALFAADTPQNVAHQDGRLLPFQSKHMVMAVNADSVSATVTVVATIWEDLTATGDPSLVAEIAQGRKETARELNETLQMLRSIRDAPQIAKPKSMNTRTRSLQSKSQGPQLPPKPMGWNPESPSITGSPARNAAI